MDCPYQQQSYAVCKILNAPGMLAQITAAPVR